MKKITLSLAALSTALVAMPTAASACDLDGLAGFHRFNPFGAGRGFNGLAPPAAPPAEKAETEKKTDKAADGSKADTAKKANAKTVQEQATPKRSWETDEGNGPVSTEAMAQDMATFT